ncbi:hypothetical protein [Micromonospora sp. WMMD714]|uniref:hypothetical protein n=1 Tax=Micromonospora sp. WMMD714 TaxID=3016097 RepID=UPI00249A7338|nr:hypothetical protein [Micromonospora sp. WMMD714]WFE61961.1 hypothetical protein O7625_01010 [Micromonospora sp. WMMD714]
MDRIRQDDYLLAAMLTLARRHRPVWSWRRWRRVCHCGAELPCRAWQRSPVGRATRATVGEMPLLVRAAWDCLDQHRRSRCGKCAEAGFCPVAEAARHRIRQWRRFRHVWGRR